MVTFPLDLFLADSDLTPIQQSVDRLVFALTRWEPQVAQKGVVLPSRVTVEGKDYADAVFRMNALFIQNQWGDGLPLVPATRERVEWILRGSDLPPETPVGKILPQGGIATVETLATALAMAGGRPEYLPVLIAAVQAMVEPSLAHQNWQSTTCSVFPTVIVNGEIARQIRLNSGFGLMGPDSTHPAGAAIGRGLRLVQQNVGGAVPGDGTMAEFGFMRYTNAVFAEDENGLPRNWLPLNSDRFGQSPGTDSVTVYPVSSVVNILRRGTGKETVEDEAVQSLRRIADYMDAPNVNMLDGYEEGTPGILLLPAPVANQLAGLGWTRERIQQFLWENSRIPKAQVEASLLTWLQRRNNGLDASGLPDLWPITKKPRNIVILVAGGQHSTHALWMQAAYGPRLANAKIVLPDQWDDLIEEAERDLGPLPSS